MTELALIALAAVIAANALAATVVLWREVDRSLARRELDGIKKLSAELQRERRARKAAEEALEGRGITELDAIRQEHRP